MQLFKFVPLPFELDDLSPILSQDQLLLHSQKHHKGYVENANKLIEKIDNLTEQNVDIAKSLYNSLCFNIDGILLHNFYFENLKPSAENKMPDRFESLVKESFNGIDLFNRMFINLATTIEGNGWICLFYDEGTERLFLGQIMNHQNNIYLNMKLLLAIDMWEHAYYVDYRNDKKTYAEKVWDLINWSVVSKRLGN